MRGWWLWVLLPSLLSALTTQAPRNASQLCPDEDDYPTEEECKRLCLLGLSCLREAESNDTALSLEDDELKCWKCLKAPEIPSWSIAFLIVFVVFLTIVTTIRIMSWCCCGHGDVFERSRPIQSFPFTKI